MLMLGETNFLQVSQLRRGLEAETARLAASRILPASWPSWKPWWNR